MEIGTEIKRYAVLAASHLIAALSGKEMKGLSHVILFGSAARGDATEESDIDLFFDADMSRSAQKALQAKLNMAAEHFSLSSTALEFKMRGISNEISIKVGRLAEWIGLNQSIAVSGIILYGKYAKRPPGLKAFTIFSWENLGGKKGAFLNKLYGYKVGGKRYPGLLIRKSGVKLGRGTVMVPSESRDAFIDTLEKYGISYSRHDVWG